MRGTLIVAALLIGGVLYAAFVAVAIVEVVGWAFEFTRPH